MLVVDRVVLESWCSGPPLKILKRGVGPLCDHLPHLPLPCSFSHKGFSFSVPGTLRALFLFSFVATKRVGHLLLHAFPLTCICGDDFSHKVTLRWGKGGATPLHSLLVPASSPFASCLSPQPARGCSRELSPASGSTQRGRDRSCGARQRPPCGSGRARAGPAARGPCGAVPCRWGRPAPLGAVRRLQRAARGGRGRRARRSMAAAGTAQPRAGPAAAGAAADESSDSEPEQEPGSPQKLIRKVSTSGQIRQKVRE